MSQRILRDASDNGQPTAAEPNVENRLAGIDDMPADPFDPESLRLSQDFDSSLGVKRVLTTIPCRKPNRHEFVRVRPGEEWRLETVCYEDKVQRETYLVEGAMRGELEGETHPMCLFLAVNRQGDVFLWPCKLPGADGRSNSWNESAIAAAKLAETSWTRMVSNLAAGYYDTYQAVGKLSEPEWPDLSFREILKLCFQDRFIQDTDHPSLRALRGEA